jgi:hypothetical protein
MRLVFPRPSPTAQVELRAERRAKIEAAVEKLRAFVEDAASPKDDVERLVFEAVDTLEAELPKLFNERTP